MRAITYEQAIGLLEKEDKDYLESLYYPERDFYFKDEETPYVYLCPLRWHRKQLAGAEIKKVGEKKYISLHSFLKMSREEAAEKDRLEYLEDLLDRWSIESSLREEPTLEMAESFVGKPTYLRSFFFWVDPETKVVVTCAGKEITRIQIGSMDTDNQ